MNASALPTIDRTISKRGVFLISMMFYGVLVPLNWLLTRLGFKAGLFTLMRMTPAPSRFEKVFRGYTPSPGDVFVSTFAKSGTNWMMQIAHQVAFRGAGDYAHIHDVISWPDMGGRRRRRMSIPLDDERIRNASPTQLRVIKTHLAARYVPYNESARYLVVVRDPKEILVSSYYFVGGAAGPLMPTFDVWFELFLKRFPLNFGSTWAEHTAGYWAQRHRPNVLVLLFQDVKRDMRGAVQQVAELLGVRLTSVEMDAVLERSTFSYMSGIEHKFTPIPKGMLPWGDGLKMMRQGQAGRSSEMLTLEQRRRIDAHFQEELLRLGSDFPYARLFAADDVPVPGDESPTSAR